MKKFLAILSILLFTFSAAAQDFDRMLFADQEIQGTARYVGMGGAFAALGGDVSAVIDNPAALGVFRRAEFSITADGVIYPTQSQPNYIDASNRMNLQQVAVVFSLGNPYKHKGLIYNNLTFQYHRLNRYSQNTQVSGMTSSQTQWMATAANEQGLTMRDMNSEDAWNNENIGWLSLMGAQGGLIGCDSLNQWHSGVSNPVNATLQVREAGTSDAYTFGWGGNIHNKVYVGLSANLRTLSYEKVTTYNEPINITEQYKIKTTFLANGLGFNAAAGVIYKPIDWLRLGASIQTPTWMNIRMNNYADMHITSGSEPIHISSTPENSLTLSGSEYLLPMRVVGGIAFQLSTKGLISLEYDYTHQFDKSIPDMHWLRVGTEWVVKNNLFLRLGYAYKSNFQQEDMQLRWNYNAVRTDTDFRYIPATHYASAGIGFRNHRWIIEAAYQYRFNKVNQYLIEDSTPFALTHQTHRIAVTLGWTKR